MRILLIGSPLWQSELISLGHQVMSIGALPECDVHIWREEFDLQLCLKKLPESFVPEAIVQVEALGSKRFLLRNLHLSPVPVAFYAIDCHLNEYWQRDYISGFNLTLVTQYAYLEKFKGCCPRIEFLPWACSDEIFFDHQLERDLDIVFVGTVERKFRRKRSEILERVARNYRLDIFGASEAERLSAEQMAKVFSRAKIVLNESILQELNFRFFEALPCGAMLLTEEIGENLSAVFAPGKHLAVYNQDNLEEVVQFYLEHSEKRAEIARAGKEFCLAAHTTKKRAAELVEILQREILAFSKTRPQRSENGLALGRAWYFITRRGFTEPEFGLKEAARYLELTRAADPKNFEGLVLAGLVAADSGKFYEARDLLINAARINGQDPRAALYLGLEFLHLGLKDDARKLLLVAAAPVPKFTELYSARWGAAIAELSCGSEFYFLIGRLLELSGAVMNPGFIDLSGSVYPLYAVDAYTKSLQADENNVEVLRQVAEIYFERGLYEYALQAFERLWYKEVKDEEVVQRLNCCLKMSYSSVPGEIPGIS